MPKLFGEEPEQQIGDELRRLKMLMETGEIATTEGQPSGWKQFPTPKLSNPVMALLNQFAIRNGLCPAPLTQFAITFFNGDLDPDTKRAA